MYKTCIYTYKYSIYTMFTIYALYIIIYKTCMCMYIHINTYKYIMFIHINLHSIYIVLVGQLYFNDSFTYSLKCLPFTLNNFIHTDLRIIGLNPLTFYFIFLCEKCTVQLCFSDI